MLICVMVEWQINKSDQTENDEREFHHTSRDNLEYVGHFVPGDACTTSEKARTQ